MRTAGKEGSPGSSTSTSSSTRGGGDGGPGVISVLSIVCFVLGAYGYLLCSVAEHIGVAPKAMSFWVVVIAAFAYASSSGFNPNLSRWLSTGNDPHVKDGAFDARARG